MNEAREALERVFGFAGFRPGQEEILDAVFAGENVLAVMPTGSGKSLCYQLPAIVRKGLTIVVSPHARSNIKAGSRATNQDEFPLIIPHFPLACPVFSAIV